MQNANQTLMESDLQISFLFYQHRWSAWKCQPVCYLQKLLFYLLLGNKPSRSGDFIVTKGGICFSSWIFNRMGCRTPQKIDRIPSIVGLLPSGWTKSQMLCYYRFTEWRSVGRCWETVVTGSNTLPAVVKWLGLVKPIGQVCFRNQKKKGELTNILEKSVP